MAQAQTQNTVETIADANVWEAVADGIIDIGHAEGVFEFFPDRFEVTVKDPANVALINQTIDASDFEHYDVAEPFQMGVDARKLDDLLGVVDKSQPIRFDYDFDNWAFNFEADGVEADLGGLNPESVNGSPVDIPPVKDELDYCVDVTLPVAKFKQASDVVDMTTDHATFEMGGDDGIFRISGKGDTDTYKVDVHVADAFEWREDPPATSKTCIQSNDYMKEVVGLLDEDTVRFVTGAELPYHLWTNRADVIDTKIMQAPRIVNE